jgi:hypothetical protein
MAFLQQARSGLYRADGQAAAKRPEVCSACRAPDGPVTLVASAQPAPDPTRNGVQAEEMRTECTSTEAGVPVTKSGGMRMRAQ